MNGTFFSLFPLTAVFVNEKQLEHPVESLLPCCPLIGCCDPSPPLGCYAPVLFAL